jgi:hypothetical protein
MLVVFRRLLTATPAWLASLFVLVGLMAVPARLPWFWVTLVALGATVLLLKRRERAPSMPKQTQGVAVDPDEPLLVLRGCPGHLGNELTQRADLVIYPQEVRAHFRRLFGGKETGVVVRQVQGPIIINVAMLPPWFDTVLYVMGDDQTCAIGLPRWKRKSAIQALERSRIDHLLRRSSFFHLYDLLQ